jgi:hypothetical protein
MSSAYVTAWIHAICTPLTTGTLSPCSQHTLLASPAMGPLAPASRVTVTHGFIFWFKHLCYSSAPALPGSQAAAAGQRLAVAFNDICNELMIFKFSKHCHADTLCKEDLRTAALDRSRLRIVFEKLGNQSTFRHE